MAWSKRLTQLNDALGDLVSNKNGISKYINSAGLKEQFINTDGSASDVWHSVLNEANKQGKVGDLVQSVMEQYPNNPYLNALNPTEINYTLSPDIDKVTEWEPISEDTLEVLTLIDSTLLPINFLAKGVVKSKSVAKVEIKTATSKADVGTGFLFKVEVINQLFFMTNYHVINRRELIKKTKVIFNFELDIDGNSVASKTFEIDPDGPWYLSPVHEYDVTICTLKGAQEDLADYKFLQLDKIDVEKNDFVNIIQHPGGEMKQISLYHNIVTNTNDRAFQYLTDTLKGSSGAPVFNSSWEVVGLHHSGGDKKADEPDLPLGFKSRNEGIKINNIIDFLITSHKNSN